MRVSDFLVIGGGVVGISIARELKREFSDLGVTLIEKEPDCGLHASSRNSGVLHAGFYYSPDSMKARFTLQGNRMLTEYVESRNLAINRCGKLVVAKDESEHAALDELLERGRANRVELNDITEKEARSIEPRVKTFGRALFSPSTSSVDPSEVMGAMESDAVKEGVEIHRGVSFISKDSRGIHTSSGIYRTGYVVNAAGLYADKIAKCFDFSENYRILPFKGLYLYSDEPEGSLRTNIYPVPDLMNPFLGVHFTVTVTGRVKIGPTAIPAFWREHYGGLENFSFSELLEIFFREMGLMASSGFDFRRLALEEIRKYSRMYMVFLSSLLADGIKKDNYKRWGRPGIRAQLLDIKKNKLEMDFVVEGDNKSMHILNAVSPAFTCSLPFAEYVCGEIKNRLT
ncbi:MAG: L-2-hydroxyglutarate oxidase [Nitrospiraceae bacterium]|nr:MAG: L-2-hydroxyglutarate oxidase [Nitrospiraceae bacterium]